MALSRVWSVILGLGLSTGGAASAQVFSPGALTRAHQPLEGLEHCTDCHSRGAKLDPAKCLDCHGLIKARWEVRRGYHGHAEVLGESCARCHLEHKGQDFPSTRWKPQRFDHRKTGWRLEGAHRDIECRECHTTAYLEEPEVLALVKETGRKTYLGAAQTCIGCHEDIHHGQLDQDCARCHDNRSFEAAPRFDHDTSDFPLTGRHRDVDCADCHPKEDRERVRYRPLASDTCVDCHSDPHAGRFDLSCHSCHVTEDWSDIREPKGKPFHARTRYPLEGAHRRVACEACHLPLGKAAKVFSGLPFEACTDCHLDGHEGEVEGECDACHGLAGFGRPRYDVEAHAKVWPLAGDHQATPCRACHEERPLTPLKPNLRRALKRRRRDPPRSPADLAPEGRDCQDCHEDQHAGQLGTDCARCHDDGRWTSGGFEHAEARFPLEGRHAEASCTACHKRPEPEAPVAYRPLERSCRGCHPDPHFGQLDRSSDGDPRDCESCHGVETFAIPSFSHEATRFPLEGRHLEVVCGDCHTTVSLLDGTEVVRYAPLPVKCAGCHVDAHRGAFGGF